MSVGRSGSCADAPEVKDRVLPSPCRACKENTLGAVCIGIVTIIDCKYVRAVSKRVVAFYLVPSKHSATLAGFRVLESELGSFIISEFLPSNSCR